MERPWKWMGLAAGMAVVLAGSLLLMGNLNNVGRSRQNNELARVEAQTRHWEARLESARSVFRELLLRNDLVPVLEHPEEYASWRVEPKLQKFQQTWPLEVGSLRGVLVVANDYSILSSVGDTNGVAVMLRQFERNRTADIALGGAQGNGFSYLGLSYVINEDVEGLKPGVLLAILDPVSVLTLADNAPQSWSLLADPQHALLSSQEGKPATLINAATWPLLVGQESGTLQQSYGKVLTFSKVRIPGMSSLLLVSTTTVGYAASGVELLLLMLAGVGLIVWSLIHFKPDSELVKHAEPIEAERTPVVEPIVAPEEDDSSEAKLLLDPHNPFPVLRVSPEGLIRFYNHSALKLCPRLTHTPTLADVLPTVDARELSELLSNTEGSTFESLFGPTPHHFQIVRAEDDLLLYGHPLSVSQSLEVALQQAQENFNTLCAISQNPILLIDPRNHCILEANDAAAALFGLMPGQLQGRVLDSFCPSPVDLTASSGKIEIETSEGVTGCVSECAMVKVEGMPAVLMALESVCSINAELSADLSEMNSAIEAEPELAETRKLSQGPAILVSYTPVVRDVCRRLLDKTGHSPEVFTTLEDATLWLISQGCRPEFAVIDITDYAEAPDWLEDMRRRCGNLPCLAISDGVTDGLTGSPNVLLVKPFDLESVINALTELGFSSELGAVL